MAARRAVRRLSQEWIAVSIFGSAFVARLVYWWFQGTRVRGDAVGSLMTCDKLRTVPVEVLTSSRVLYAGFDVPFCTFLSLTGDAIDAWVVVQITLSALSCVLLYYTGRRLVGPVTGIVAAAGFTVLWETFRFSVRPQSDLLFVFAVTVVLWQIARYVEEQSTRTWWGLFVALLFLAITRPFGIPIVAAWLVYDLLPSESDLRLEIIPSRIIAAGLAAAAALTILFAITYLDGTEHFGTMKFWSGGVVVTKTAFYHYTPRPANSFWGFIFANADHLAVMSVLRVGWFFVPVLPRWSTSHIALNLVTLAPLVVGTIVGTARILRRREWRLMQFWLTPLVAIVLAVALTYLEGGFNYRAPATPMFALLTGYAVETSAMAAPVVDRLDRLERASRETMRRAIGGYR